MHPLPYIKKDLDYVKGERNSYYFSNIFGVVLLVIVFMFIAPFFHEFLHIFFLESNGSYFYKDIRFTPVGGVYGEIVTVSALGVVDSVVLLLIGVFGNAVVGLFMLGLGFLAVREEMFPESNFFVYMSLGFLSDPVIYLFLDEGDLVNALTVLGLTDYSFILPLLGVVMVFSSLLYLNYHLKHNIGYITGVEKELRSAEGFLEEIMYPIPGRSHPSSYPKVF